MIQLAILGVGIISLPILLLAVGFGVIEASASVVTFGFSYELSQSIDSIGSDLPFVTFLVATLGIAWRFQNSRGCRRIFWGLVVGIAIAVTMDIRTVGIILLPSVIWTDFMVRRRIRITGVVPVLAFAAVFAAERFVLGSPGGAYSFVDHYRFFTPLGNARQFFWSLAVPLDSVPLGEMGLVALSCLAAAGVIERALVACPAAWFVLIYTSALLVLPNFDAGPRYLVPQLAFLGAFASRGAGLTARLFSRRDIWGQASTVIAACLGILLFFLAAPPFSKTALTFGAETTSARQVFQFLKSHTPSDAIIASSPYRSFHLFTGRETIRLPSDPSNLDDWLARNKVQFVVLKHSPTVSTLDFTDCPKNPLCHLRGDRSKAGLVFYNQDFEVLDVDRWAAASAATNNLTPAPPSPGASPVIMPAKSSGTSASRPSDVVSTESRYGHVSVRNQAPLVP